MGVEYFVAKTFDEMIVLEDLAKEALAESRFNAAIFSSEKFTAECRKASKDTDRFGVLIAKSNESVAGVAYCAVGEPLIGSKLLITTVQLLYVRSRFRTSMLGGRIANSLLNGLISWSRARNSQELLIHSTSGIKPMVNDRFFKKRKLSSIGGSYAGKIL